MRQKSTEQWFGLDLIRLVSVFAISVFHANEAIFYTNTSPLPGDGRVYPHLLEVARHLVFSGFTIVAISGFLFGQRNWSLQKWLSLLAILTLGTLTLPLIYSDDLLGSYYWEWDIYAYLIFCLAILLIIRSSSLAVGVLGLLGAIMLIFPAWQYWGFYPVSSGSIPIWRQAFTGVCYEQGGGAWPIFPWAGLLWSFYAFGYFYKRSPVIQAKILQITRMEIFLWLFLIGLGAPYWGAYYSVPIGPGFYCFAFRQPPWIFWSHFVIVIFLMRLSLVAAVQAWLARRRGLQWLSRLHWSRHFGLCYLLHLVVLGVASQFSEAIIARPWIFDVVVLSLLPVTEAIARAVSLVFNKKLRRSI